MCVCFVVVVFSQWDMTPLMLAIKGGHKELATYLVVEVRAELNIQAMKVRNIDLIQILEKYV